MYICESVCLYINVKGIVQRKLCKVDQKSYNTPALSLLFTVLWALIFLIYFKGTQSFKVDKTSLII
jgi:hypothetical protein